MFSLFNKKPEPPPDVLALQTNLRRLKLDLAERDKTLARIQAELERLHGDTQTQVKIAFERLGKDVAGPMAQLLAQAHLLEHEGKPVQTKDVLSVTKRLLRVLAEHGITAEAEAGTRKSFDPNRHEPLSAETTLHKDEQVIIKFPAILCHGTVVRKAGVIPA
jgi:molecular chaperone GrpE (heat shock protein)